MKTTKPKIAIVSSTNTKIGAVLLHKKAINLDCDPSIVVIGQANYINLINNADKRIFRVGPKSHAKYAELLGVLKGKAHVELGHVLTAFSKVESYRVLSQASIPMPTTWVISRDYEYPGGSFVVKIARGNRGDGIRLINSQIELESFFGEYPKDIEFIAQEYIVEAQSRDKRLFVVGDKVVAAMVRQSISDDFRSNLHLGATGSYYTPTMEEEDIAIRSIHALGLDYGGVDIIDSNRGPLVLEVNPSPGFGISEITGIDVPSLVIKNIAGDK